MNWETLLCLGDSITIGARSYCGYPEYTGSALEKEIGNRWNVINHATSGFTAMDLHRSITNNFSNLKQFEPGIVTLLIGTNDVKKNTSVEDFTIAYNLVVMKAMMLAVNRNLVLVKIPYFPKNIAYPYNYNMNERVARFNEVIDEIAKSYGARTIEFDITEEDLFDGVHLNTAGSRNAGCQLCSFILKDKGWKEIANDNLTHLKVLHG